MEASRQTRRAVASFTASISRRNLLRTGIAGSALGVASLAAPVLSMVDARAQVSGPESTQVAEIYQLQAAFHRAKTTQDIDLMMSLWAPDAIFVNRSTGATYSGSDAIRGFWLGSGSFTHHRFSLVPSFKTTINVKGDEAFLYFECHDVGNFSTGLLGDLPADASIKTIVNDTFLAGTLRNMGGAWLFQEMTAGPSSPLSFDHLYFP